MTRIHLLLLAICLLAAAVGVAAGPTGWIGPWNMAERLAHGELIVTDLRAPRVCMSAIVGGSLAVAGATMQTLVRNDLADPYVLGLSGGASAGAVCSLAMWPLVPPNLLGAVGATGAAAIVRGLARGPYDPTKLVLVGATVGSLLTGVTGLVLTLAPQDRLLRSASFWLFGGMGTPRWSALAIPGALLALALVWLLPQSEKLDRLTMGEDLATSLGVDVRSVQRWVLAVSVLLTATAVGVGGLVGFVGLVAPHGARTLVGPSHRAWLPATALLGAALVVTADTVARTAFAPQEVPVGLLTAGIGGPFFLVLLRRRWT